VQHLLTSPDPQNLKELLKDKRTLADVSKQLLLKFDELTLDSMKELLLGMDPTIFVAFRDGKMSLDQAKTRVLERLGNTKFYCLDDLKEIVDPSLLDYTQVDIDEYIRLVKASG